MRLRFLSSTALACTIACGGGTSTDAGADSSPGADAGGGSDASADAAIDAASDGSSDASSFDASSDAASADAASCDALVGQLEALTDGLFYTSEGDEPIDVALFAGEGAAAPAPADVARLSGIAGGTTETRTEDELWAHVVVDPTRTPPIPGSRPADLRAAFEAATSDRIVVRVIDPADPVQVHVHLAGRTECGDLVWLASISVET